MHDNSQACLADCLNCSRNKIFVTSSNAQYSAGDTASKAHDSVCLQAFNLVDTKELVPLHELIDQMVS